MRRFKLVASLKSRRPRLKGFTLIEVLASVVIIVMAGTAALFAVESVQAGQLKEAEYSKALGLATTIAEEIRDRDPNAQINVFAPITQTTSLSTSGGSVIATLFSSLQIFQNAVSTVYASLLNTILQTGAWGNLDLQNLVENLIDQPTSQWGQQIQLWMQQGQITTVQQSILQNQQALLPFEVVVPGDALGDNPPAQDAVLYVPSPASLSSESSPGSINGTMTYTEFVLALARGGEMWNQPYTLMDGYTCTVNAQRVSSSNGSMPSLWSYTVTVRSPHGATATVTVPVVG